MEKERVEQAAAVDDDETTGGLLLDKDEVQLIQKLPIGFQEAAKAKFLKLEKTIALGNGNFWTPLEELYEAINCPFANGYHLICARIISTDKWTRPENYEYIVKDLKALAEQTKRSDEISLHSAHTKKSDSSSNASKSESETSNNNHSLRRGRKQRNQLASYITPKNNKNKTKLPKKRPTDCLGGKNGNRGHLIPQPSTLCAPRYGIIAQPVLGFSFEDFFKEDLFPKRDNEDGELREVLKKILQLSVISDGNEKMPHGLASRQENILMVPKGGHKDYFDQGCQWFFIPVMTLEEALLGWPENNRYKVMVIAGDIQNDKATSYDVAEMYRQLIPSNVLEKDCHGLLKADEIKKATSFITDFAKAIADMVTGRGEAEGFNLTPNDLDRDDKSNEYQKRHWQDKLVELDEGRESLMRKTVKVPFIKKNTDFSKIRLLGLTIEKGPDPALLGIKNAISWMTQNGQRPLPACGENEEDSDHFPKGSDENYVISSGIPEFVSIPPVTPSPPKKIRSGDLSLGSDDSVGSNYNNSTAGSF